MTVQLKRNDTKDTISYTITNPDGSVVNLTGAAVKFVMGKGKTLITNASATIVSAAAGTVSYTLTENDTLAAGTFNAEFEVAFSNGKEKTYPTNGYIQVKIEANIDKDKSTYVEDQIAYRVSDIQILKNSIQAQLDQFAKGDSAPEVAQSRVEADGTTNATLKARLDKKEAKFASDIASLSSSVAQIATYVEGDTFDYNSLSNAIHKAKQSKSKILNLGSNRTFNIGLNTLDFSNLIVEGNNVVIQGGGQLVISVNGSIGSYASLNADVFRGGKSITSSLASSLVAGDLVKIISDKDFSAGEVNRKQGEMHVVQSISGTQINFTDTLFDDYSVSNNARVAKVSTVTFSISEGIKIKNTGSGENDQGLSVNYAYNPVINCSFEKCGYASLLIQDCYRPKIDVIVNDSTWSGSDTSYGVTIGNATMYASVKGTINFCRHCVAHGGNLGGGVSWESRIEVDASGNPDLSGSAALDAHPSTGSVYFINCTANNSTFGIKANARYNYIKNCFGRTTVSGADFVVVSNITGHTVNTLEVDGVSTEGYGYAVHTYKPLTNLSVKNIKSNIGVCIRGDVAKWRFSDFDINTFAVIIYSTATSIPDTLHLSDCRAVTTTTASTDFMVYNEVPALKNIILTNCRQKHLAGLVRSLNNLDSLELYNCYSFEPYNSHVFLNTLTLTRLVISGGVYKDNQRSGTIFGTVLVGNVTTATIENITTSGANLGYIIYGNVTTLMHFGNSFHTLTSIVGGSTPAPVQIIGGSLGAAKIYSGTGTPEGVVTGKIGDMFLRSDGGAATTFYIKESGTGNTGWIAK
jgi:hypothetical protein